MHESCEIAVSSRKMCTCTIEIFRSMCCFIFNYCKYKTINILLYINKQYKFQ